MTRFDTAADVRAVKALLLESGWTSRCYRNHHGEMCLHTAIFDVVSSSTRVYALQHVIAQAINTAPVPWVSAGAVIVAWNDVRGRTFNEVIDMLDKAEKLAEATGRNNPLLADSTGREGT